MCRYYARHAPQIPFLRLVRASPPTSLTHSAFEQSNCESEFQDSHLQAIAILELQVPPFPPPHTQRLRKENLDACSLFYHLSMYHRFYQSQSFFAASLRSALLDPLHDLLDRFPAGEKPFASVFVQSALYFLRKLRRIVFCKTDIDVFQKDAVKVF